MFLCSPYLILSTDDSRPFTDFFFVIAYMKMFCFVVYQVIKFIGFKIGFIFLFTF